MKVTGWVGSLADFTSCKSESESLDEGYRVGSESRTTSPLVNLNQKVLMVVTGWVFTSSHSEQRS